MHGPAGRDIRDVGRRVEVRQLRLQLVHHVWTDGGVGRSRPHVDLAALEVADRVDLFAAPALHVGDGGRDGWVLIVHTRSVLPPVSVSLGCGNMTYRLAASAVIWASSKDPEPDFERVRVCNTQLRGHESAARETGDRD